MGGIPVWLSTMILGMGTVFTGLFCLILIIHLLGYLCRIFERKTEVVSAPAKSIADVDEIPNRPQFIAAVSAAIATATETDAAGLRIVSVKKVK